MGFSGVLTYAPALASLRARGVRWDLCGGLGALADAGNPSGDHGEQVTR